MRNSILMEVVGRQDLTRDLGYGVGRAINRVLKRVRLADPKAIVDLSCEDTQEKCSFTAGDLRTYEGLHALDTWLQEQAHRVAWHRPCVDLRTALIELRNMPADNVPHLHLDMDGVFADFDLGYPRRFNHHHLDVTSDEMWSHVDSDEAFYANLPVMDHGVAFYGAIKHLPHSFLSVSRNEVIQRGKLSWLMQNLNEKPHYIPVYGKPKTAYMASPGAVLLDDHKPNTDEWAAAGGKPILHENFRSSALQLHRILTNQE